MKRKLIMMLCILMAAMICLSGCGAVDDMKEDALEELKWIKENNAGGEDYNPEVADALIDILGGDSETPSDNSGKAIIMLGEVTNFYGKENPESCFSVVLTEYGTGYDALTNKPEVYIKYTIENIGNDTVTVGNALFNVYADDYAIEQDYLMDGVISSQDISPGRKVSGVIWAQMDIKQYKRIEVELANVTFSVYDQGPYSDILSSYAEKDVYSTYCLFDFDIDDNEELIITYGPYEADMCTDIYSMDGSGNPYLLGSYEGGYVYYPCDDERGYFLCAVNGRMGYYNVYYVYVEDGMLYMEASCII